MGNGKGFGGIAQSGERCFRKAEVGGSNPLPSTNGHLGPWRPRATRGFFLCVVFPSLQADIEQVV